MDVANILLVEDDQTMRSLLKRLLTLEGHKVVEAASLDSAYKALAKGKVEVAVLDMNLPDGSGIEFIRDARIRQDNVAIIVLTGYANVRDGVEAIKAGAYDYLVKGEDNEKLLPVLSQLISKINAGKKGKKPEAFSQEPSGFDRIVGHSPIIRETIALAQKVAVSETTVLLLGETGTGKELFAKAIHAGSPRSRGNFFAINCSAFSKNLLESEIFGYKAGAFTGAYRDKKGLIEEANGGTLFLDEIGEMDLELQAKLLRLLENSEFIKVGDTRLTKVNVRIIAATNRHLENEVRAQKFRKDLYYRLNAFMINLPPLRERKEDIPLIVDSYLEQMAIASETPKKSMSPEFLNLLQKYNWEGNIRELKNILERAVILAGSDILTPQLLPNHMVLNAPGLKQEESLSMVQVEKMHILSILKKTYGNKVEAAKILGISLTTLYRKIDEYQLFPEIYYMDGSEN